MLDLKISENAKLDIEDIFEHTIIVFGERKAYQYSNNLYGEFQLIQENPNIGHNRKDIPYGFLTWPFEKHFINYEIWENTIYINRVLHSKMNFIDQFN